MNDDDENAEDRPSATIHRLPIDPWSIAGLHTLDSLTERHPAITWQTGFYDWNSKVRLSPGTLSVVTGLPGSGKTVVWAQVWSHVVGKYGLKACIASFECAPKPYYRRYLREIWARCREQDMTDVQIADADAFIRDHYWFLLHPEETPTLDWFLEMAYVAADKGCAIIQLDPWNRLESQRGVKETEPEYVSRCLRALSVLAKDMNIHVQIVAHPAKRDARRRDIPPELEDISGAMHWWNMVDQGFIVHREKVWDETNARRCYAAKFLHRKARFEELGYPCALDIRFNPHTRVFESVQPGQPDDDAD
jgi:twinkle protein